MRNIVSSDVKDLLVVCDILPILALGTLLSGGSEFVRALLLAIATLLFLLCNYFLALSGGARSLLALGSGSGLDFFVIVVDGAISGSLSSTALEILLSRRRGCSWRSGAGGDLFLDTTPDVRGGFLAFVAAFLGHLLKVDLGSGKVSVHLNVEVL